VTERTRFWIGCVVFLSTAAACDSATKPAVPSAADLIGAWELVREANGNCEGATATAIYYFDIGSDSYIGQETGALNVVAHWDVVIPYRFGWMVSGNYNVRTRSVELNFWHRVFDAGSQFIGTLNADNTITGQILDPKPGYDAHFVSGSCVFQAHGLRAQTTPREP
jgi:hypothetical protein